MIDEDGLWALLRNWEKIDILAAELWALYRGGYLIACKWDYEVEINLDYGGFFTLFWFNSSKQVC